MSIRAPKPELLHGNSVVALGVTTAREVLGRPVTLSRQRAELMRLAGGRAAVATIHPSGVLRMRHEGARASVQRARRRS
ncbi:hypothetical protein MPC4_10432 [Methylocella tundrae]|uniref:Uncharacterized protein n=1 Tax=Methylocella tundrae TaxID=227605 RepID=A0A8B6M0B4_METTU|nr:hypothetical protein MPC1_370003 [Methylocella tundrae]VTZ48477.1 hypothetical protein MPC4_10432 [Methylocella tundrae]